MIWMRGDAITDMNIEAKFYAEAAAGMMSRRVGEKLRTARLFFWARQGKSRRYIMNESERHLEASLMFMAEVPAV